MKTLNKLSNKSYWLIIIGILILTSYLRWQAIKNYNIALTYDQGRDLMEIASIVVGHRPALVGPTTSVNGAFLGPFWYYFNTLPFWLGRGDPMWIMAWQILWFQLTGLLIWLFFRFQQPSFGFIFTLLYLLMPTGFYVNRFFWNVHPMPLVTVWVLLTIYQTFYHPNKYQLALLGFLTGIALQIEAAYAILFMPLTLVFFNQKKMLAPLILGFSITLIPQFIYELRHQFIITKTLISQFTGQTNILAQNLSLSDRLVDRYHHYINIVQNSNHLPANFTVLLFVIALIFSIGWMIKKRITSSNLNLFKIPIFLFLSSLVLYLIFPQPLKSWYIDGLSVPIVMITSLFLAYLWQKKYFQIFVLIILVATVTFSVREELKYIHASRQYHRQDPSNLYNQMQVVDWIYQQAQGRGFWVYSYLPSVYDYAYQHVFWWYGTEKYGYQPEKITYADNVPQYVKSQPKLWTQTKPTQGNYPIFLIIEPDPEHPERQQAWLNNFQSLCTYHQQTFPWGTQIQVRGVCQPET